MKAFGFVILLFLMIGAFTFVQLGCSNKGITSDADMVSGGRKGSLILSVKIRKLKSYIKPSTSSREENGGHVNVEDYGPIDPSPNSKASVRPGPIMHGTPLQPYIPRQPSAPPPHPTRPKHGADERMFTLSCMF